MDEKFNVLARYNLWANEAPDLGYQRQLYTAPLRKLTGNRLVKVLVGQRRVGKSYILRQVACGLVEQGVPVNNIFMLNKELMAFDFVRNYTDLDHLFNLYLERLKPTGKVYIFLDEVQNIEGWERFVNSYSQDYRIECEIFITGSNSRMLSSELATLLSGRYVEIPVYSFSYDEFIGYHGAARGLSSYQEYMHSTGLPEAYRLDDGEMRRYYVDSLRNTIILRDIVERNKVRDIALLEELFAYLVNNASSVISLTGIVNYLKSQKRRVSYDTIATYVRYLEDVFLVYRANRYNIRGKAIVGGNAKYYLNDLAFHNYLYRGFGYGEGYLLENAVYLELRRHGFDVYVGNIGQHEVDFTAFHGDRVIYLQAAYSIGDEATARREYSSLEAINDSYEKYVVTLDAFTHPLNKGIRHVAAWDLPSVLER